MEAGGGAPAAARSNACVGRDMCLCMPLSVHKGVSRVQRLMLSLVVAASLTAVIMVGVGNKFFSGSVFVFLVIPATLCCAVAGARARSPVLTGVFCCCNGTWGVVAFISTAVVAGFLRPAINCICDPACTALPATMAIGGRSSSGSVVPTSNNLTALRETEEFQTICANHARYEGWFNTFTAMGIVTGSLLAVVVILACALLCCYNKSAQETAAVVAANAAAAAPASIPVAMPGGAVQMVQMPAGITGPSYPPPSAPASRYSPVSSPPPNYTYATPPPSGPPPGAAYAPAYAPAYGAPMPYASAYAVPPPVGYAGYGGKSV